MLNNIYYTTFHCRICKNINTVDVINIGEQSITSRFPILGDFSIPKTPINLCLCTDCGLLQLRQTTETSQLYEHDYGYMSGISNTMRSHLQQYQAEILSKITLNKGDVILDIGSNDSTFLQFFQETYHRIGIDPTGKQFEKYYKNIDLITDYFTKNTFMSNYGKVKCKIISSISMFYDLQDPVQFAKDIYDILDDDGIWTCEQSYLLTMLRKNSFDTICHEHLEYYALHQIYKIAEMANFKIIDVSFNNCNGGSFRIYFSKKSSDCYTECTERIQYILQEEIDSKINDPNTYINFMKNCDDEMDKLRNLISDINNNGEKIWIYGASTKGNCLLQYAKINNDQIQYAVERNPQKIGKMTATGIEIISEETMRQQRPEYLLVLPWHFRDEIIERERDYLNDGGKIVFPLPILEIYGRTK